MALYQDGRPPSPAQKESEQQLEAALVFETKKPNQAYHPQWYGKHPLEWAVGVLLFLTFIATGLAAVYTGLEQSIMKKQTGIMQDQEDRQLRGYIFATARSASIAGNTGNISVQLNVIGQTPIFHIHSYVTGVTKCNNDLLTPKDFKKASNFIGDVLFPGENGYWISQAVPLTTNQIAGINLGTCNLVIYGVIEYYDAFKFPHYTTLCYIWNMISEKGNAMKQCASGNSADGEENYKDNLPTP